VKDIIATKSLAAASITVLTYDYLLTISDEILLVWYSPLLPGTVFLLLNRYVVFLEAAFYMAFLFQEDSKLCSTFFELGAGMTILGSFMAESVIYLRTYAILGGSRLTMVILILVNLSCLTVSVFFAARGLLQGTFSASLVSSVMACSLPSGPKWITMALTAMMLSELVIAVITIRKAFAQRKLGPSSFTASLYRDGLLIFAFLFGIVFTNIMLNSFSSLSSKRMLLILPQRVLHSILLGRMLLHLRKSSQMTPSSSCQFSTGGYRAPSDNIASLQDHSPTMTQPSIELPLTRIRNGTILEQCRA